MNSPIFSSNSKLSFLVVEDHATVRDGTLLHLKQHFKNTTFHWCGTIDDAIAHLSAATPDLILLDLSLPQGQIDDARIDKGIDFLKKIIAYYPELNITIQSSYIGSLARLFHEIEICESGFTVVDKKHDIDVLIERLLISLKGYKHTKDVRSMKTASEFRPEEIEVIQLAFREGLQDKSIAKTMHISERRIRQYWTNIYDRLGIYPDVERENGRNLRIQAEKKARELGLID